MNRNAATCTATKTHAPHAIRRVIVRGHAQCAQQPPAPGVDILLDWHTPPPTPHEDAYLNGTLRKDTITSCDRLAAHVRANSIFPATSESTFPSRRKYL